MRDHSSSGPDAADAQMHPLSLVFLDRAREARFVDFLYVKTGFYGGKLYHVLGTLFIPLLWIYWYGLSQEWSTGMFTDPVWAPLIPLLVIMSTNTALLFVDRLKAYREMILVTTIICQCPVIMLIWHFGMGKMYTIRSIYAFYYQIFTMYLPQARFSRIMPPLVLLVIPTLAIGVVWTPSYWDTASHMEIVLWVIQLIPPFTFYPFERENRRAFYRMEQGEQAVATIEAKAARTRAMIVNFFAKTPTRDFLATGGALVRQRHYDNVAMVVTDLAGFTSWTSSVQAVMASEQLSLMFDALDIASEMYGVEKISTVGDSYQGAIFAESYNNKKGRRGSNAVIPIQGSSTDIASAALAMLEFGQNAIGTFSELQMRVGAHMGSVTAAFVGTSPPKFDLFGDEWELTKMLESDGVPGRLHASKTIVDVAAPMGAPEGETQNTANGVVIKSVRKSADAAKHAADETADDAEVTDGLAVLSEGAVGDFSETDVKRVCESLMRLGGVKKQRPLKKALELDHTDSISVQSTSVEKTTSEPSREHPFSDESQQSASVAGDSILGTLNSIPVSSMAGGKTLDEQVALTWKLQFQDAANERMYQDTVKRGGFVRRANAIVILMNVAVLAAHHFLGCIDTVRNRILVAHAFFILSIYTIVELVKIRIPHWTATTFAVYSIVPWLIGFSETTCDAYAGYYLQPVVVTLIINNVFSFNFMIHVPLLWRIVVIFIIAGQNMGFVLFRRYGFEPVEEFVVDISPLIVGSYFFLISVTNDYTMRLAFAATRKVKIAIRRNRAGLQHLASTAVDIMVPQFVSERLTQAQTSSAFPRAADSDIDEDDDEDDENDGVLNRDAAVTQTWEFDRIAVMFINFDVAGGAETNGVAGLNAIDAISDTFNKLEVSLNSFGIQKIKTIGTTLMCAYGMGSERDPTFVLLQAASQMVQRVLRHDPVTQFRVGVHVGPAFGAVMGRSSILFDIFGDSVNMASRMASTAESRSVQVSSAVHARCSHHSVLRFEKNAEVAIKGKGRVATYSLLV